MAQVAQIFVGRTIECPMGLAVVPVKITHTRRGNLPASGSYSASLYRMTGACGVRVAETCLGGMAMIISRWKHKVRLCVRARVYCLLYCRYLRTESPNLPSLPNALVPTHMLLPRVLAACAMVM